VLGAVRLIVFGGDGGSSEMCEAFHIKHGYSRDQHSGANSEVVKTKTHGVVDGCFWNL
jgi:hypothetical protein